MSPIVAVLLTPMNPSIPPLLIESTFMDSASITAARSDIAPVTGSEETKDDVCTGNTPMLRFFPVCMANLSMAYSMAISSLSKSDTDWRV